MKWRNNLRIFSIARKVAAHSHPAPDRRPVVFFNASTRLGGVSQNAAFAFLSSCGLQLFGLPIVHFVCRAGMSRCPLGTVVNGIDQPPPCRKCIAQSKVLASNAPTRWFKFQEDPTLAAALVENSVEELGEFTYNGIPLGPLTLPSMRWVLRRHHLPDDGPTRQLFRQFILSAFNVVREFSQTLDETDPQAIVVFNGVSFPEAAARWVATQRGVRAITHEVAHQPLSAFFSHGHVTAYPVHIPSDFELSPQQNDRLDAYLENRFQGQFSMAGIEFWPEMKGLDEKLVNRIEAHRQLVPVFTNVIFDTSQIHANVIFEHMFAWLDQILEIVRAHPETLFVIRAHPDELRSGKASQESVEQWLQRKDTKALKNLVFIPPQEYVSSYALIQRAKFAMVYNSTIGLETVLMGKPVLNGGKARYTQVPCVYLPPTPSEHHQMANAFLAAEEVTLPEEFIRNARRFQYFQLFRTPLPFDDYLAPHPTARGYVTLRKFPLDKLEKSETIGVIREGILEEKDFLMPEEGRNREAGKNQSNKPG